MGVVKHRLGVFAAFLLLLLSLFPAAAFANAPVPMYFFTITVENPPEGSWGVDFLVPEDSIPREEYTECNREALKKAGIPEKCELASLNADGYVSYMCHDTGGEFDGEFTEAVPKNGEETGTGEEAAAMSFRNAGYDSGYNFMTGPDCPNVRLAVISRKGKVLAVSAPFEVRKSTAYVYYGEIRYDAAAGTAETVVPEEGEEGDSLLEQGIVVIAAMLAIAGCALVTMTLEFLLALAFKLKPAWWTLLVNICSNLCFNFVLLLCTLALENQTPYWAAVYLGEFAVVVVEFLIYRSIYGKTISHKRILAYTIVANLASALFAMLLAAFIEPL